LRAASNRLGEISVLSIDFDASITSMIVPPVRITTWDRPGRAAPTKSEATASSIRIAGTCRLHRGGEGTMLARMGAEAKAAAAPARRRSMAAYAIARRGTANRSTRRAGSSKVTSSSDHEIHKTRVKGHASEVSRSGTSEVSRSGTSDVSTSPSLPRAGIQITKVDPRPTSLESFTSPE
jgi:hypothetical protein